jgi:hypothetical protein
VKQLAEKAMGQSPTKKIVFKSPEHSRPKAAKFTRQKAVVFDGEEEKEPGTSGKKAAEEEGNLSLGQSHLQKKQQQQKKKKAKMTSKKRKGEEKEREQQQQQEEEDTKLTKAVEAMEAIETVEAVEARENRGRKRKRDDVEKAEEGSNDNWFWRGLTYFRKAVGLVSDSAIGERGQGAHPVSAYERT